MRYLILFLLFVLPAAAQPVETERGATHTVAVDAGETLIVLLTNWGYQPAGIGSAYLSLIQPDGTPLVNAFGSEEYSVQREFKLRIANPQVGTWTAKLGGEPERSDHLDIELIATATPPPLSLSEAIEQGDLSALALAISSGESALASDVDGYTPLHRAAAAGHLDIVRFLLGTGAEVNATHGDPRLADYASGFTLDTPLHLAAGSGYTDVIRALVESGADLNATSLTGDTPLHSAAWSGQLESVRMLLDAGADPSLESESGTPLDIAQTLADGEWTGDSERASATEIVALLKSR